MSSKRTPKSASQVALVQGFRSGLEGNIQSQLTEAGLPVLYEQFKIPWVLNKDCNYTPDFWLPNGVIIESKGRFVTSDRQKHIYIQQQYPALDIRFVFSRSVSKISKSSKTSYAKWCATKGFAYADKLIPPEWIEEPINTESLSVIRGLYDQQDKDWPL